MDNKNESHLNEIIDETFKLVKQIYQHHNAAINNNLNEIDSRLIFPKNNKNKTRVSEQELRFAFVEVFNCYVKGNNLNWFYSIEEPTKDEYSFSGKGKRSALVDLCIMDNHLNRIALIEFKANNPDKEYYEKDLVKLSNPEEAEGETLMYFLQIVENHNRATLKSIDQKSEIKLEAISDKTDRNPIHIRVYSIAKDDIIIKKTIKLK